MSAAGDVGATRLASSRPGDGLRAQALATQKMRTYVRFSDMAQDMVDVRIYHGVHFRKADEEARKQGRHVAQWVFGHFLRPLDAGENDADAMN
jgi:hypothetical protein